RFLATSLGARGADGRLRCGTLYGAPGSLAGPPAPVCPRRSSGGALHAAHARSSCPRSGSALSPIGGWLEQCPKRAWWPGVELRHAAGGLPPLLIPGARRAAGRYEVAWHATSPA